MTQSNDTNGSTNGYILVAEDNHIVQLVIKEILEQAGYKADLVNDGEAAVRALESQDYDLVLMDCFMPVMDGFEATRLIRLGGSDGINPVIPVIALTGLKEADDQARCLEAGMNDFIGKPVDSNTLVAAIERHLGKTGKSRSSSQQSDIPVKHVREDAFLEQIIDKFLEDVPQVIAGLQRALDQGDAVKLQHIAHRLRGATDVLEISTLSVRAQALELAGKAGDIKHAGKLAPELIRELQKLMAVLTEDA